MTVAELIALLSKCPPDAKVLVHTFSDDGGASVYFEIVSSVPHGGETWRFSDRWPVVLNGEWTAERPE